MLTEKLGKWYLLIACLSDINSNNDQQNKSVVKKKRRGLKPRCLWLLSVLTQVLRPSLFLKLENQICLNKLCVVLICSTFFRLVKLVACSLAIEVFAFSHRPRPKKSNSWVIPFVSNIATRPKKWTLTRNWDEQSQRLHVAKFSESRAW